MLQWPSEMGVTLIYFFAVLLKRLHYDVNKKRSDFCCLYITKARSFFVFFNDKIAHLMDAFASINSLSPFLSVHNMRIFSKMKRE